MGKFLFFILSTLGCSPDYSIVTGETETIVVTETVTETETVEIEVPVYIEVEVPSDAEEPGLVWVDSFTQPMSLDGIDILWVIDRSGSMNRFNPDVLAGVQAMLTALPSADWRVVMINADPNHSVTSNVFPLVPGDDILDAEVMLSTLSSAHKEEGFNAVYEYIVNNPYSSTWMRNDAGLLVVFVSDEEEQSDYNYPAALDFISWYSSLRMGSVFMASIVNLDSTLSMCDWPPSVIDVGDRYIDATLSIGGTVIDICDEDWSPGVTDATHSVEPYEKLTLSHKAIADSVRVFVNGSLSAYGWYYQESDNTVYFSTIPSAGELVEIGYRYEVATPSDTGP